MKGFSHMICMVASLRGRRDEDVISARCWRA
jgi:hypothetical protein